SRKHSFKARSRVLPNWKFILETPAFSAGRYARRVSWSGRARKKQPSRSTRSNVPEIEKLRLRVKGIEAQLVQSQKLQPLGALAGGVAHDFNNLLTAILGHASLLAADVSPDSDAATAIGTILGAADRASQLTRQLLNFARPGEPRKEVIDI